MNQHLPTPPPTPTRRPWQRALPLPLLEAGLLLTWSSGFIGARFSIDHAPALLVVFWRCLVVSLLLLPFVWRALRHTPFAVLLSHAGIGLLAMAGYLTGVTQGIALGVPAGLAALCADLLPLGMALLAALVLGERLPLQVWVGLVVGLLGVLWVTHDALKLGTAPLWAYGLPVAGMCSLAVATLWQQRSTVQAMGLLPNLWLQCFVSSFAFAAIEGSQRSLAPVASAGFALSVSWTAVLSTLGGMGCTGSACAGPRPPASPACCTSAHRSPCSGPGRCSMSHCPGRWQRGWRYRRSASAWWYAPRPGKPDAMSASPTTLPRADVTASSRTSPERPELRDIPAWWRPEHPAVLPAEL